MAIDLTSLIAAFQQSQLQGAQQQGVNQAAAADARIRQQREALTPRRFGMSGGMIDPTTGAEAGDPFKSGFFKSMEDRKGIEMSRLGGHGSLTATPAERTGALLETQRAHPGLIHSTGRAVADPFDESGGVLRGADINFLPDAQPGVMDGGFAPTTRAIPGGFEGMINPMAPDATRFSDANMFTALGKPNLPPGAVIGDGTTNYKRKKGAALAGGAF